MKRITKIVALAAIALFATAAVASAAVAVDSTGDGSRRQGRRAVRARWNNGDFDTTGRRHVRVARTMTRTTDNLWVCTDGSARSTAIASS